MSHLSDLILNRRKELNMSQGVICRALGYTTAQYLSNFERDLCSFPVAKLRQLSVLLDIPPRKIFVMARKDWAEWFKKEWRAGKKSKRTA